MNSRPLGRRLIAATILGIAAYYAVLGGEYSLFDLRRLAKGQRTEAVRLAETRAVVDSLHAVVERLENDPAMIESVARERFGMIRDGELLYRFVDTEPAPDEAQGPGSK